MYYICISNFTYVFQHMNTIYYYFLSKFFFLPEIFWYLKRMLIVLFRALMGNYNDIRIEHPKGFLSRTFDVCLRDF